MDSYWVSRNLVRLLLVDAGTTLLTPVIGAVASGSEAGPGLGFGFAGVLYGIIPALIAYGPTALIFLALWVRLGQSSPWFASRWRRAVSACLVLGTPLIAIVGGLLLLSGAPWPPTNTVDNVVAVLDIDECIAMLFR